MKRPYQKWSLGVPCEDTTLVKGGRIVRSDALKTLEYLPPECVDLIVFDPAYESLEKWRKMGTTTRLKESKGSSNKWFPIFPNKRYAELLQECHRVLKPGSHCYIFCDEETRDFILTGLNPKEGIFETDKRPPLSMTDFKFWKSLVWSKIHPGMGYHYRASYEFILFLEKPIRKGKYRRLNDAKPKDVLEYTRLKGKKYYPTEKPFELIQMLVEQSSDYGDTVLDMFCGSGVVGQVCRETGRQFILGDLNTDEAVKRLA